MKYFVRFTLALVLCTSSIFALDAPPKDVAPQTAPAVTAQPPQVIRIEVAAPTTQVTPIRTIDVPIVTDTEPTLFQKIINACLVALGTLFTAVSAWFFAWLKGKIAATDAQKDALEALHAGVDKTYLTLYQQFKDDNDDGVLTTGEKAQLRQNAINEAMSLAKGPALAVLKATAVPMLESLVQRIVQSKKKAAAALPVTVTADTAPASIPAAGPTA